MEHFQLFDFELTLLTLVFVLASVYQTRVLGWTGVLVALFLAYFTRSWNGSPHSSPEAVASPCEGEIIEIKRLSDHEVAGRREDWLEIVVFLNLHNIHLQYVPFDGKIVDQFSQFGKFKPAKWPVSRKNYKITTVFETEIGPIVLEQISGFLVRKIVNFKKRGERVRKGQPLGMIKFGSRCQLYLPLHRVELAVETGDHVKIGQKLVSID
jgi:phosphatidylserine decarboxylase